jgi:hypothetical protein
MGWSSCNKSNASLMNKFITLLFLLGLTPVLFGNVTSANVQKIDPKIPETFENWSNSPSFQMVDVRLD